MYTLMRCGCTHAYVQPHALTHVLSYRNILYLYLHICTHTSLPAPTSMHLACMQALNDVKGIDTGVGARQKAGSGKGLVMLGRKSGLASKPAYSFWPEFCMDVVKSTVYCRVLHLCRVRLLGQGRGAACILYYSKLQHRPERLWRCQSQLWQAFLSNYTCKGWVVVFVHFFFFKAEVGKNWL